MTTTSTPHSRAYLNQRRFLMVVPLIVVPFLLIGFYAMGGGSGPVTETAAKASGINTALPGATISEDRPLDKMGFYEQAQRDSAARAATAERDPYHRTPDAQGNNYWSETGSPEQTGLSQGYNGHGGPAVGPESNETRLRMKIDQLNASLNSNATVSAPPASNRSGSSSSAMEVERLQSMIVGAQGGEQSDPEMAQINNMLNQVLDIQHPERVQERMKSRSLKANGQVFAVTTTLTRDPVTMLDNGSANKSVKTGDNGFYSLAEAKRTAEQNAVEAVTSEAQTLISGSVMKLKLLNDVYVNGQMIPRNTYVFGTAGISGERLTVNVTSIRYGNSIYPVSLSVFDLDGMDGIHIPGAITRDVAKQTSDDAIQSLNMSMMDASLGTQAMGAGLQAAKSLIGKKVKLIKVFIKPGYRILLKDERESN